MGHGQAEADGLDVGREFPVRFAGGVSAGCQQQHASGKATLYVSYSLVAISTWRRDGLASSVVGALGGSLIGWIAVAMSLERPKLLEFRIDPNTAGVVYDSERHLVSFELTGGRWMTIEVCRGVAGELWDDLQCVFGDRFRRGDLLSFTPLNRKAAVFLLVMAALTALTALLAWTL